MKSPPQTPALRSRERGSIIVSAVFAVLIGLVVLLSVQVGYLFYMKRELQKAADLAALSAAQVLVAGDDTCAGGASATILAGQKAAVDNVAGIVDTLAAGDVAVSCWLWDPSRPDAGGKHLFAPDLSKGERLNAVQVRIDKKLGALIPSVVGGWMDGTQAGVQAIAVASVPTAAFGLGSNLVGAASTGALASLLRVVGVDPDVVLVGYGGLADVEITPAGLLRALDIPVSADMSVGDLNALLSANQVSVGRLLDAVVKLAGHGELVASNAALVTAIETSLNLKGLNVLLGTDSASNAMRGLFAAITAPTTAQEALGVKLDALGLVTSAIGVATAGNAATIDIPASNVLSVLGLDLSVKAAVVEPPSIGIGRARNDAIAGAKAYTSQVRLNLNIGTSGLVKLLGTSISLPVFIDVVNAHGELTQTVCSERPRKAVVEVTSTILSACIGQPMNPADVFSKQNMCATNMAPDTVFASVLGLPLLHGKIAPVSILPAPPEEVTVTEDAPAASTSPNPIALATTIAALQESLLDGLVVGTGFLQSVLQIVLDPVLDLLAAVLDLDVIGKILSDLLANLGLELGTVDVQLHSIDCGQVQLVY